MLKNLKIGTRMSCGFGIILVLMIALIVIGILGMSSLEQNLDRIVKINNVRASLAGDMNDKVREVSIALRNALLVKDSATRQEMNRRIAELRTKYNEAFGKMEEMTPKTDTKGIELISKVKAVQEASRPVNTKVIELSLANKDAEAGDLLQKEARPLVRKWIEAVDELNKYQDERTKFRYDEAVSQYRASRMVMIIVGLLAFVTASVTAIFLTRSIVTPINKAVTVSNALAAGDLSMSIDIKSKDETGQMLAAMQLMVEKLRMVVSDVRGAADNVASGAQQLSSSATQMSQGATEQAS
ncbi:MAG TPA: MCP four helix bundle domain-containing protein, partial [Dissulfurispiraceae bacterium]|nr:MCP four helix bundle domain-containing protein [Dissulfurispiraceae bacterium]